jgi:hypothetical protein
MKWRWIPYIYYLLYSTDNNNNYVVKPTDELLLDDDPDHIHKMVKLFENTSWRTLGMIRFNCRKIALIIII